MCFEGLLEDDNEYRASAQEALSSLAAAYAHSPPDILEQLMKMLLKYGKSKEYRARHCAVQMATRIFPITHVPTRYLYVGVLWICARKLGLLQLGLSG